MKIGILTHQYINNYGAFLQAWALREAISELFPEDEVQIIDYVNIKHYIINAGGWFRFYKNRETLKEWFAKIHLPNTFAKARNQEMVLSKRCFNARQINELAFDCIVVGSDEVWNYRDTKGNAELKFGVGLTCKNLIAYAPSVGKTAADEAIPQYVIDGIRKFKRISARDDLTEQLVEQVTGNAPKRVLDPTFLAEFPRAELKAKRKPYILFYYCENLPKNILNQIFYYAKEHGLAVYGAGECDKRYSEVTVNLTPFEWVEMFRNAEFVFTGTFHGAVFSILNRRQFNVIVYFIVWIALELNCKKLVAGEHRGTSFSLNELVNNIKGGILLTVGNLSSVVLTSMDRWFVKALMTTLAFAQYSFAVSMENFMNVAVTPVTTTLYNYFCKATDKSQIRKTRNYVMVFAAAIVSCAFPARFILEIYLTKYIDSAKVMFLLFAAQIFYIVIKSVYVNLYKAQKKQNIYFIKLTMIIVVGFIFNIVCYGIYKVKESFAVGTLLSAICWYFLCLPDFKWMEYNTKEKLYPFIQTCAFLVCGFCFSAVPGFLIYIFEIAVVSYVSFPREVREFSTKVKIRISGLKR